MARHQDLGKNLAIRFKWRIFNRFSISTIRIGARYTDRLCSELAANAIVHDCTERLNASLEFRAPRSLGSAPNLHFLASIHRQCWFADKLTDKPRAFYILYRFAGFRHYLPCIRYLRLDPLEPGTQREIGIIKRASYTCETSWDKIIKPLLFEPLQIAGATLQVIELHSILPPTRDRKINDNFLQLRSKHKGHNVPSELCELCAVAFFGKL